MDFMILNSDFVPTVNFDTYESFIWTDKYNSYGDFEIYTKATKTNLSQLRKGHYIYSKTSEHLMIIEDRNLTNDPETGPMLTVRGRSLESILDRRVIMGAVTSPGDVANSLQTVILNWLQEAIIDPTNEDRKISNFTKQWTTNSLVVAETIGDDDTSINWRGENLYSSIQFLCSIHDLGFKITLNSDNKFVFTLYAGADRSWSQTDRSPVVFSPNYDNLINSDLAEVYSNFKTYAYILGGTGVFPEGEDGANVRYKGTLGVKGDKTELPDTYEVGDTFKIITAGTYSGSHRSVGDLLSAVVTRKTDSGHLNSDWQTDAITEVLTGKENGGVVQTGILRKEIFVDKTSEKLEDKTLTEYKQRLQRLGLKELRNYKFINSQEASVDCTKMYKYGKHFFMGDIVQFESEFGVRVRARITGFVTSDNLSGFETYPTFDIID